MKKIFIFILISVAAGNCIFSQSVQGEIVQNTNPYIIKVWGNHYERGYAMGYLLGSQIAEIYSDYVAPQFGSNLALAKLMIQQGLFDIDSVFISEAQGTINGITDAGYNSLGLDYLDVLVGNCFLDFQNISSFKNLKIKSPGCSSLISWGDATSGSELSGKSIITRHLDWSTDPSVINNQAIIVHFPSDPGEQPWLLVGFCGQMGVLSGVNQSGLGVFQHSMSDSYAPGTSTMHYEPVWLCLRRALEQTDINNDGVSNTLDMRAAALGNVNGFADGYIVSAIAPNTFGNDSLCAMIAELAPAAPLHTFRDATYPDAIHGDNIYAANYEIKRNNHLHYCFRYDAVVNALDAIGGINIGRNESWTIMADSSNAGFGNVQMMQYVPEDNEILAAFHPGDAPAYECTPVLFDLNSLFTLTSSDLKNENSTLTYPNPATNKICIEIINTNIVQHVNAIVCDFTGRTITSKVTKESSGLYSIDINKMNPGIYFIHVFVNQRETISKIVVY